MGRIKYVGCKVVGCLFPHRSRGYCRKHYRIATGEGKRRYQKVKNNPNLSKILKDAVSRYRKTDAYRKSKKKSDVRYYQKNKDRILQYRTGLLELKRFGVKREDILKRDNYKCTGCGNPLIEQLIVHHINGLGRSTNIPDNDPRNLVTLCRSCHMKLHLHP